MKCFSPLFKTLHFLVIVQFTTVLSSQIIADHSVVDKFDDIPQQYIDEVKKMWLVVAGESHSEAYRVGLYLLGLEYPAYSVSIVESGTPEGYTTSHLRVSRATWGDYSHSSGWIYDYGEEDWWTNSTAISRTKAGITYCNTHNLTIGAMGFGWCWDANDGGVFSAIDPLYGCRWMGILAGTPGNIGLTHAWGLDDADNSLTGNIINMDDYLSATEEYINYCKTNGYSTKVFFTTGPVDEYYDAGEDGYQASLKWQHIRNYVNAHSDAILFDYADILCYNDDGTSNIVSWNGHTFPRITTRNVSPIGTGHISSVGATRLAKALWWMLARIAGWNGSVSAINDYEKQISDIKIEVLKGEIKVKVIESVPTAIIELFDLSGNLIDSNQTVNGEYSFASVRLMPGIYIVNVTGKGISICRKVMLL